VTTEQPADEAIRAEAVEFEGPGAIVMRGQRFGVGDRWALLAHGVGKDLDVWRRLAPWLAGRSLAVLAFDLPGHGASDDPWDPRLAPAAVAAAVAFAREQGARQVHLVGEGVAAIAALAVAAADSSGITSVTALSPQPDDRVADNEHIREARIPKLILVGSSSRPSAEFAELVYRRAIGPCEMARFPVAAQGSDLLYGEWGEQALEKVLAHLLRQG
jgi:pimeloyl-ACP methyl ester carboxylesterase